MPSTLGASLCAYRTDSGAIIYTNTTTPDGLCATATDAPPVGPVSARVQRKYDGTITLAAQRYGVSTRLIHAVIATESAYNPGAVSPKGAKGLMQLMPATAQSYGVSDLMNPDENIRGGVAHLRDLLDQFGGDTRLAVAAYNAGSQAVRKYSGVPPFTETKEYVRRVLGRMGTSSSGLSRKRPEPVHCSPVQVQVASNGLLSLVN